MGAVDKAADVVVVRIDGGELLDEPEHAARTAQLRTSASGHDNVPLLGSVALVAMERRVRPTVPNVQRSVRAAALRYRVESRGATAEAGRRRRSPFSRPARSRPEVPLDHETATSRVRPRR